MGRFHVVEEDFRPHGACGMINTASNHPDVRSTTKRDRCIKLVAGSGTGNPSGTRVWGSPPEGRLT
eukprot:6085025-Pyramimonas_sp.AAC.1